VPPPDLQIAPINSVETDYYFILECPALEGLGYYCSVCIAAVKVTSPPTKKKKNPAYNKNKIKQLQLGVNCKLRTKTRIAKMALSQVTVMETCSSIEYAEKLSTVFRQNPYCKKGSVALIQVRLFELQLHYQTMCKQV